MAGCAHPATARPDQGHSATEQDQLNQDTHATPPRRHGKNSRLIFPLVRSSRGNFGLVEAQSCDDEFDHATCVVAGGSLPGASGEASSQTHLGWFAERSCRPDRSRSRTTPPNAPARLGRHVPGPLALIGPPPRCRGDALVPPVSGVRPRILDVVPPPEDFRHRRGHHVLRLMRIAAREDDVPRQRLTGNPENCTLPT